MSNSWDPTYIIDEDTVKLICKEQFPDIHITEIECIGEGFDNTVFKINKDLLMRFPRRDIAVPLIELEKKLLPQIERHIKIKTTIPTLFGKPSTHFPWPFLGYNFIYGKSPTCLSVEDRKNMVEPLALFIRNLHEIDIEALKPLNLPYDEIRRLDLEYRIPQLKKHIEKANELNLLPEKKMIQKYVDELEVIQSDTKLVLVHGDLHFKNILVDDQNRLTGIIDWGDTHIGQRELDLSIAYSILLKEERERFFKLYGTVNKTSKRLAKFKSIYTTILLLLFANDKNQNELVRFCQDNIKNALID